MTLTHTQKGILIADLEGKLAANSMKFVDLTERVKALMQGVDEHKKLESDYEALESSHNTLEATFRNQKRKTTAAYDLYEGKKLEVKAVTENLQRALGYIDRVNEDKNLTAPKPVLDDCGVMPQATTFGPNINEVY